MSDPTSRPATDGADLSFDATLRGMRAGQKVFSQRYTLLRILGRGGMGVVWLARDEELRKDVALKFLPEFVALDKVALDDLREETRKSLDLTHPHIVRTYTLHSDMQEEIAAIVMEVVEGGTLSDVRLDQPGKVFEASDIAFRKWVGQLCGALAYAHARKRIVHRDLKPGNLMVDKDGDLKVTDFGIARSLSESRTRLSRKMDTGGTLPYMSPQQALGEPAAESDDIYSLGATLYELLTGKPPFFAGEIYEQIKTKEPVPLTKRREELNVKGRQPVPDAWERAVLACLAKKPEDRPASVAALARLLALEGEFPDSAPEAAKVGARGKPLPKATMKNGRRPALLALAMVPVLVVAGWWVGVEKPKRDRAAVEAAASAANEAVRGAKIEGLLGTADSALARRDLLAARAAYEQVLEVDAAHPRARSGLEGLKGVTGGLEIRTSPPGATVLVGEQEAGVSPCSVKGLALGKHSLTIRLEGYDPVTDEIMLRDESLMPFSQKLTRQRGSLRVESTPAGAGFTVKMTQSVGRSAGVEEMKFSGNGKTPQVLEDLPTGDYEVKLSLAGYETASLGGKVKVGEVLTLSEALEEKGSEWDEGAGGKVTEVKLPGGVSLKFAYCPPGSFMMGSPASEADRGDDERQVQVRISQGFWLGQYEVTQGQWAAVMGTSPAQQKAKGDSFGDVHGVGADHPMYFVSWEDAQAFISKLNQSVGLPEGWKYALPSEAQWEYACRAGTESVFSFGNTLNGVQANCDGNYPYGTTQKGPFLEKTAHVGSYRPNAWGLYDMHGNVWEWCADAWDGSSKLPEGTDPLGSVGSYRVLRGGSWRDLALDCRAASRGRSTREYRDRSLGFRVAAVPAGAR